jgi:hypothetical protein
MVSEVWPDSCGSGCHWTASDRTKCQNHPVPTFKWLEAELLAWPGEVGRQAKAEGSTADRKRFIIGFLSWQYEMRRPVAGQSWLEDDNL